MISLINFIIIAQKIKLRPTARVKISVPKSVKSFVLRNLRNPLTLNETGFVTVTLPPPHPPLS